MRFKGWQIDRFGVLEDYQVKDLPAGLTVFQGPNESGKSTLLTFLRSMLFGFTDPRGQGRRKILYPMLSEGRHGGMLQIESPEGVFTIDRDATKNRLHMLVPDGSEGKCPNLAQLLGPVDRTVFETVFAFGLEDLVLLKTMDSEEIKDRIYSASIGDIGCKAKTLIEDLAKEAQALWEDQAPGPVLEKHLDDWVALQEPLRDAEQAALNYPCLREKEAACLGAQKALAAEFEASCQDVVRANTLIPLYAVWEPIRKMREELDSLEPIDSFVDEPEARLAERRALIQRIQTAIDQIKSNQMLSTVEQDESNPAAEEAENPQAKSDDRQDVLTLVQNQCELLGVCNYMILGRKKDLARLYDRLGPTWDEKRIKTFVKNPDSDEELRSWQARLQRAEDTVSGLEEKIRRNDSQRRSAEEERERLRQALYQARSAQAKAPVEKDTRMQEMAEQNARIAELEIHLKAAQHAAGKPCPRWWSVGAAIASVFLSEAAAWSLIVGNWVVGAAGLVVAAVYGLGAIECIRKNKKYARGRMQCIELENALTEARQVKPPVEKAVESDSSEDDQFPSKQTLTLADNMVQAATIDDEHLKTQLEESKKTLQLLWQAWYEYTATDLGFESAPKPEKVLELWTNIEAAKEIISELKEQEALKNKIKERNLQVLQRAMAKAEQALQDLFDEAGAVSEEDFLEKFRAFTVRQELKARIRFEEEQLINRIGEVADAERIREELESGTLETWQTALEEAKARSVDLQMQRDKINQVLAQVQNELAALEESDELAILNQKRENLMAIIQKEIAQWRTSNLEKRLVAHALENYIQERQPAVLKEAGRIFSKVTQGRYTDLILKQDETSLAVIDDQGEEKDLDQLSLGTTELLYLCMRFSLVHSFAENGVPLPLVMDDVLVNFDPERAQSVAKLLKEIAKTNQVLIFTCHPQTVSILKKSFPKLRVEKMPTAKNLDESNVMC